MKIPGLRNVLASHCFSLPDDSPVFPGDLVVPKLGRAGSPGGRIQEAVRRFGLSLPVSSPVPWGQCGRERRGLTYLQLAQVGSPGPVHEALPVFLCKEAEV